MKKVDIEIEGLTALNDLHLLDTNLDAIMDKFVTQLYNSVTAGGTIYEPYNSAYTAATNSIRVALFNLGWTQIDTTQY